MTTDMDHILGRAEVLKITNLSASTLRRMEASGAFPARLQIGPNRVGYRASQVSAWVRSREPVDPDK